MRVVAEDDGVLVGGLGRRVLASQAMQFGALVVRHPGRRTRRIGQPSAGAIRLGDRLVPGASHLGQLGSVDEALPAEGDEAGLCLAPAGQRRRPLLGPPQVEGLLTGQDHGAVDESGRDRRHAAGVDGHHRLVEVGQPAGGLAEPDQRLALPETAESGQVVVAEALTDRGGLGEPAVRCARVTAVQLAQRGREQ